MWLPIVLFAIGLVCLIKGGDWFVDGATGLARRFHVPEFIIGATIVSIGTTLPEVMVSSTSALKGIGDMAYGNAVGSVICNTALISALTIAIRPTEVERKSFRLPVFCFFIAAAFFLLISYLFRDFARITGIVLLLMFIAYMTFVLIQGFRHPETVETEEEESKDNPLWKTIVLLVVGAALIAVGARLLVNNGTKIAQWLGVPDTVIALTFVALGTSLPELVTAISALVKGHSNLSLGNIIGANFFNLALVCGTSITLAPFRLPIEKTIAGLNASLVVDLPLMLLVMLILTVPTLIRQKLSRVQGILLLLLYAGYVTFQFAG
ncbi:MAG: calcium/sodium antiporter [Lachnospiraceae bacterium]|nr:calcium/sodium antiporter [Lachnospiraceae bacterium]